MTASMHLLIPTAQRPDLFARVLESLCQSDLPDSLRSVIIVENGEPCGVEELCQQAADRLPIDYRWSPPPSKSIALNLGLEGIPDDDLVVMSDDDVRFEPDTLLAYERAVAEAPEGKFYGGPFRADFAGETPPDWVLAWLPNSACGWSPDPQRFDPKRACFYGCNWAVFARDLRAVGGFDTRLGPGGVVNATGEETQLQRALLRRGLRSHLVSDAVVWHYVPAERCSPAWAVHRARRHGAERGFATRRRGVARKVYYNLLNGARFLAGSAIASWTQADAGPLRLQVACEQARSSGFFQGYYRTGSPEPQPNKPAKPRLIIAERITRGVRKRRGQAAKPGALPLRWHCGRPNFGDDINPSFFERASQRPMRLATASDPHLLGMGSLLEKASSHSYLLGAGFLNEPTGPRIAPLGACSVRGELSASHLEIPGPERAELALGDPAVLFGLFAKRSDAPKHAISVIPHVSEIQRIKQEVGRAAHVIDVRRDPWKVIEEIGNSALVLSQSLHGLITADALGIPNGWIAPSPKMLGGEFKFRDYYTTTDQAKRPLAWSKDLLNASSRPELFVSRYRYDKQAYLDRLRQGIDRFASRLEPGDRVAASGQQKAA